MVFAGTARTNHRGVARSGAIRDGRGRPRTGHAAHTRDRGEARYQPARKDGRARHEDSAFKRTRLDPHRRPEDASGHAVHPSGKPSSHSTHRGFGEPLCPARASAVARFTPVCPGVRSFFISGPPADPLGVGQSDAPPLRIGATVTNEVTSSPRSRAARGNVAAGSSRRTPTHVGNPKTRAVMRHAPRTPTRADRSTD